MKLPPIKLDFLEAITDDTGVFQHTKFGTPNRLEGYTTDDNARALIAVAKHSQIRATHQSDTLIDTYLSFLLHMQRADGKMHNFLSYDRNFLDEEASEDCAARTLLGLWIRHKQRTARAEKKRLGKRNLRQSLSLGMFLQISDEREPFAILWPQALPQGLHRDRNLTENIKALSDRLAQILPGRRVPAAGAGLSLTSRTRTAGFRKLSLRLTEKQNRQNAFTPRRKRCSSSLQVQIAETSHSCLSETRAGTAKRRTTVDVRSAIGGSSFL